MKTIFSEKNPYGQKPKEQKRIKNIFKSMKSSDDKERLVSVHKRFNKFVNSNKKTDKVSNLQKYNNTMKNINKQIDKIEKELL
jgi:hypothetical protein|tara:strand:- start:153 stop:401 length:249 start_codon:yes stop_codon:yes gene_type:complete